MSVYHTDGKTLRVSWERVVEVVIVDSEHNAMTVQEGSELELRREALKYSQHYGPAPFKLHTITLCSSGHVNLLVRCQNGTYKMIGKDMVQPYREVPAILSLSIQNNL